MPKPIKLSIEVEEIALGSVLRQLNRMTGVAKVDMNLDDDREGPSSNTSVVKAATPRPPRPNELSKKKNGIVRGRKRERPRFSGGVTGDDFMITTLYAAQGRAMRLAAITDAFVKQGRAAKSPSPILHFLKKKGIVSQTGAATYALTKKGRERASRMVAAAKEAAKREQSEQQQGEERSEQ